MATSGTVGRTTIPTNHLLEHAFRRVRVQPALQTPEMVAAAKRSLYMLLVNLANRGINLWCVQSDFIGLAANQQIYSLQDGTIDVLNVIYSQPTRVTGTDTVAATTVTTALGESTSVRRIGVKFSSITAGETVIFSSSADNVTYTQLVVEAKTDWEADRWYWFELPAVTAGAYFRVAATAAITVDEFYLATAVQDLPVSQWSRDTWAVLPNKAQVGKPSTNFYLERLLTPQLSLWPIPNNDYDHLTVFAQRQVQDIGTLVQEVELPQRWLENIIWQLALRLLFELKEADMQLLPAVQGMVDRTLIEAERDESDGAPLYLSPNVGAYTA